jgi:hypothetical protein
MSEQVRVRRSKAMVHRRERGELPPLAERRTSSTEARAGCWDTNGSKDVENETRL